MVNEIDNSQRALIQSNNKEYIATRLELFQKRRKIIIWIVLIVFILISINISCSFKSPKILSAIEQCSKWQFYRSDTGTSSCMKQSNNDFGYPEQLVEDLVRDKQISFVFPVHAPDRDLLVDLLRSIRNLCIDCAEVPVIVITDDASKKDIYESLYHNNSRYLGELPIAQAFPKLSIKLLRDVMPYYMVNKWTDESLLVNGKYLIQSHKKMFGVLNGASTRFSWVMDVDTFFFRPMSLSKVLKTYLSSPYIMTTHDWPAGQGIFDCAYNLTGSSMSTGYTVEAMHWIFDQEILSDFNNLVLKQYPTWNVPMLFKNRYFFEHVFYHFIMSSQIQHRKYMQYKIIEIRTLLGGNQSPLLQAVKETAAGGLIERVSNSITRVPSIYQDIVNIWKKLKIPIFRPQGSPTVILDFVLDTDVVILTNHFTEELYKMGQSGYWKNPEVALQNAEKQGWKALGDHLKKRNNKT